METMSKSMQSHNTLMVATTPPPTATTTPPTTTTTTPPTTTTTTTTTLTRKEHQDIFLSSIRVCVPFQPTSGGVVTNYLYDGDNVIADIDTATGTVVRTYVTPGLDSNVSMTVHGGTATTYYYNQDERQSVMNLTDSTGVVAASYGYSAYGDKVDDLTSFQQSSLIDQRYMFTGRELSPVSDDYYFRCRWYGPHTGSFLTKDPLEYIDGMSAYLGYFSMMLTCDPWGLAEENSAGVITKWWYGRDHAAGAGEMADQVTDHIHVYDKNGKLAGKIDLKTGKADDALTKALASGKVSKKAIQKNLKGLVPKIAAALRKGGQNAAAIVKKFKGPFFRKIPIVGIVSGIFVVSDANAEERPQAIFDAVIDPIPILGWAKAFVEQCFPKPPQPMGEYIDTLPEGSPRHL